MRACFSLVLVGACLLPTWLSAQTPATERQLTLSEALDIAEKESETVAIARAEVARAEGDRRRARSAYFPQLSGSASYQRTIRSQFSALGAEDTTTAPIQTCNRFVPQPGNTVEQRLDSLESAVECASGADPFASFRNLPFGRVNAYRFGLAFSQTLFTGGQLGGQSQAATAGARSLATETLLRQATDHTDKDSHRLHRQRQPPTTQRPQTKIATDHTDITDKDGRRPHRGHRKTICKSSDTI